MLRILLDAIFGKCRTRLYPALYDIFGTVLRNFDSVQLFGAVFESAFDELISRIINHSAHRSFGACSLFICVYALVIHMNGIRHITVFYTGGKILHIFFENEYVGERLIAYFYFHTHSVKLRELCALDDVLV